MTKYEEYQLQWMIAHGHSLIDFVNELIPCVDEVAAIEPNANLTYCIKEGFYDFVNDRGFGGELWACKNEWEDYEGKETTEE